MNELDTLRNEIFAKVAEYYERAHASREFVPGVTRVNYAGRVWDAREMINMTDALLEFWLTAGRHSKEFEQKLGSFLGVREVIPVNSGSSANLVALTTLCSPQLRSRRLEPGDEVIVPAASFPTTVAPIVQNQLVPVLVDSRLGDYNLDIDQLEAALSERTGAIMFAHTLGNPADMDRIVAFAREHELYIIEDTCDALGSRFGDRLVGTFGHIATLSFYPAHHITMGEGGAIYTTSRRLARIARTLRDWGRDCYCGYDNPIDGKCGIRFEREIPAMPGFYDHRYLFTEIGYNLKITDIQAAMGVVQMDKLEDFIATRKRNFKAIYAGLKKFEEFIVLPEWHPKADPSWFAFPITVRDEAPFDRTKLTRYLEEHLVETRVLFAGNILMQPGYRNIQHRTIGDLSVSDHILRGTFFVGVYPGLDKQRIDYMLSTFADFFKEAIR